MDTVIDYNQVTSNSYAVFSARIYAECYSQSECSYFCEGNLALIIEVPSRSKEHAHLHTGGGHIHNLCYNLSVLTSMDRLPSRALPRV